MGRLRPYPSKNLPLTGVRTGLIVLLLNMQVSNRGQLQVIALVEHAYDPDSAMEWHRAFVDGATVGGTLVQGLESACMLGNLRAGCKYALRVRCQNVAGWGSSSPTQDFVTMPDVPDPPLDIQTVVRCAVQW